VAVDRCGRLLKSVVTAGQRGDAPQAPALPGGLPRGGVGCVIADAAYDSEAIRRQARRLRAKACIRPNPTRRAKRRYDKERYRHRNVVERFFGRIKRCRRAATRDEKKAADFAGFVWLAAFVTAAAECP
jgi:transposase